MARLRPYLWLGQRVFGEQQGLSGWFLAPGRWLGVGEVGNQSATSDWGSWVTSFPAPTSCFSSVKGDGNNLGCSKDQRCDGYKKCWTVGRAWSVLFANV